MGGRRRLGRVVLAAVCAALVAPGVITRTAPAQEIAEFPQENAWWLLTPSVIWSDETFTLEIHVVGRSDVVRVGVYNLVSPETTDPFDPASPKGDFLTNYSAVLFDDGTRGDRVAGDGVFSREGLAPAVVEWSGRNNSTGTFYGNIRVQYADGTYAANSVSISGAVVNAAYRNVFEVEDFGDGLSATAYAFFIDDADHEVIDDYPIATVYCGTSNFEAYRKLYSVLPDAFDFATVTPGMQLLHPDGFGENVPYTVDVSNAIRHTGNPVMDRTARFGSAGRLKAAIYNSFGNIFIMDHEIAHAWGAQIGESLGLVDPDGAHWSASTDIDGQLSRFFDAGDGRLGRFVYNGDETWRFVDSNERQMTDAYSPLELYLMGLIPPDQVPPIHILHDPDLTDPDRVTVASYTTVTIDDIMAAEGGGRTPAYPDSQTDFTMAYIVTQDRPFDDAGYAYFSLVAYDLTAPERFEQGTYFAPFHWATGGRATLDTRLPVDLSVPDIAAVVVPTTTTTVANTIPPTLVVPTSEAPSTSTSTTAPAATDTTPADDGGGSGGLPLPLVVLGAVILALGVMGAVRISRRR